MVYYGDNREFGYLVTIMTSYDRNAVGENFFLTGSYSQINIRNNHKKTGENPYFSLSYMKMKSRRVASPPLIRIGLK